jgi:hypothetical protein
MSYFGAPGPRTTERMIIRIGRMTVPTINQCPMLKEPMMWNSRDPCGTVIDDGKRTWEKLVI